jgi:MFS family permease
MLPGAVAQEISRWPSEPGRLTVALAPRDDVVGEREVACGAFEQAHGPFRRYRRTVVDDGTTTTETIQWSLALPWVWWLFHLPVRRELRRRPEPDRPYRQPWWAPPERLDQRAASTLAVLAVAAMTVGYTNTLLTQTIAFAGDDFGSSDWARSVSLAIVRSGIVIALGVMAVADRVGRRRVLIFCATIAPIAAAAGALAPNLAVLTLTQAIGRPLGLSLAMVVAVLLAEEMPKGSRAYAIGMAALAEGFGAGHCVLALRLADLSEGAWRIVYLLPLLYLFLVPGIAQRIGESKRFVAPHAANARIHDHAGRFWLVALSGLAMNLLVAPASGFQNQFLKEERGYDGAAISLYTLVTQTPAGIGVLLGGIIADAYGRKVLGAVAISVGAVTSVLQFYSHGWSMWMWSFVGAIVGGAAVPAVSTFQTELFPTAVRARAKGGIIVVTLVGSSIGLLITGALLDRVGYGPIFTILLIGPLTVAALIAFAYPETRRAELEDLNPEDRVPGSGSNLRP